MVFVHNGAIEIAIIIQQNIIDFQSFKIIVSTSIVCQAQYNVAESSRQVVDLLVYCQRAFRWTRAVSNSLERVSNFFEKQLFQMCETKYVRQKIMSAFCDVAKACER